MDGLIQVCKGYIPKLGPLGPLLHVEKFVVGVGGLVVCKAILVITHNRAIFSLNNSKSRETFLLIIVQRSILPNVVLSVWLLS